MQFFLNFFPSLSVFRPGVLPTPIWIDGEVLALGGLSFTLLSLFAYVAYTQIDKKEMDPSSESSSTASENKSEEDLSPEFLPVSPILERMPERFPASNRETSRTTETLSSETFCHSFYLPIQGGTLEAVRRFLEDLPSGEESWEVSLFDPSRRLETVGRKTGNILVFPTERREGSDFREGVLRWPLTWESSPLGEVRRYSSFSDSLSKEELGLKLDRLTEELILGGSSQDSETGWGSYSFFAAELEQENGTGEEPKILVFMEFSKAGNLLPEFKSFGRWWRSRFGEVSPLSRVRKNRLASILTPADWIRFQESLSGLMQFLGPDTVSLNIGASIRVRPGDIEWESRAKKALHSSKEEGSNRLVCL